MSLKTENVEIKMKHVVEVEESREETWRIFCAFRKFRDSQLRPGQLRIISSTHMGAKTRLP